MSNAVTKNPSQTAGLGLGGVGAIATLLAGLPPGAAAAITFAVGLAPVVFTWLQNNGGIFGAVRSVFRGNLSPGA